MLEIFIDSTVYFIAEIFLLSTIHLDGSLRESLEEDFKFRG